MLELTRTTTHSREHSGSGGNFFDAPDSPNTVTVSNGPYGDDYPVAGMTVAQIRNRLRDRLDIDPLSQAILDGHDVGEDTVVQHGQALMFAHRASEKGANRAADASVTIEKNSVTATSPEGTQMKMKVSDLIRLLAPPRIDTGELVLPAGTRSFRTRGRTGILIHETPPRVHNFKWIDEHSPAPFGQGAKYRTARIGLPYVVVFAVFEQGHRGTFRLSDTNECFFAYEPLVSLEQKLFFPALLNCSRFDPPDGHPLSWICTQHLQRPERPKGGNRNQQLHRELKALLHCLFETGFNYSSEHHEAESWFSASQKSDKRLASVAAWEEATEKDSLCALDIAWLPANLSAGQIVDRIFANVGAKDKPIRSADDLARLVFNSRGGAEEKPESGIRAILQLLAQQH